MQIKFGVDHLSIKKFIKGIKKIQCSRNKIYEQFVRGEQS